MKKIICTSKAPTPIGPYSQAILVNNTLYASGQIAIDPVSGSLISDNLEQETNQVMANIKHILSAVEMDFSHVVKSTIFLKDMNDFAQVNDIYGSYFSSDPPARECVQVARLPKDANVEITVIAVK